MEIFSNSMDLKKPSQKEIEDTYKFLDADNDQKLDFNEVKRALIMMIK